ncbi:MAG: preprotein translocase subunit YajC [Alistipes sp.]|jgi:preprotein translocase subunit YajC|nr:preprotein translocase subunit YajC [Alistipes sp.]
MFTLFQAEVTEVAQEAAAPVATPAPETLGEAVQVATETASEQAVGGIDWTFWALMGGMILIIWLFMWRPEAKRRKEMEKFRNSLKKGDKIITAGGIYGIIKEVKETTLLIEVDSNVTLRIDKNMVVAEPIAQEKK